MIVSAKQPTHTLDLEMKNLLLYSKIESRSS